MKRIMTIIRIITAALALLASGVIVSCDHEEPDLSHNHDSDLMFTFTLDVGKLTTRGDADETWSGPYDAEAATGWENTIHSMAVYAYFEGNYFGRLTEFIQVSSFKYQARLLKKNGEFANKEELEGKIFRFHVFINSIPEPANTETDLISISASQLYDTNNNYLIQYMPMWGVKQATLNWEFISGTDIKRPADIGTVNLLRSLAKVEIELTNEEDRYDYLDNVSIGGLSAKTFCYVPGYKSAEGEDCAVMNVEDTKTLNRYHSYFNFEPEKNIATITFYPLASNKKRAIFYIPEQTNSVENELTMTIKSGGELFDECPLKFRKYSDGHPSEEPFNIMRNFHYRYRVTIKKNSISVDVMNWEYKFNNHFTF